MVPLLTTLSLKWFDISEIAPGLVVETNDFYGAVENLLGPLLSSYLSPDFFITL